MSLNFTVTLRQLSFQLYLIIQLIYKKIFYYLLLWLQSLEVQKYYMNLSASTVKSLIDVKRNTHTIVSYCHKKRINTASTNIHFLLTRNKENVITEELWYIQIVICSGHWWIQYSDRSDRFHNIHFWHPLLWVCEYHHI